MCDAHSQIPEPCTNLNPRLSPVCLLGLNNKGRKKDAVWDEGWPCTSVSLLFQAYPVYFQDYLSFTFSFKPPICVLPQFSWGRGRGGGGALKQFGELIQNLKINDIIARWIELRMPEIPFQGLQFQKF